MFTAGSLILFFSVGGIWKITLCFSLQPISVAVLWRMGIFVIIIWLAGHTTESFANWRTQNPQMNSTHRGIMFLKHTVCNSFHSRLFQLHLLSWYTQIGRFAHYSKVINVRFENTESKKGRLIVGNFLGLLRLFVSLYRCGRETPWYIYIRNIWHRKHKELCMFFARPNIYIFRVERRVWEWGERSWRIFHNGKYGVFMDHK